MLLDWLKRAICKHILKVEGIKKVPGNSHLIFVNIYTQLFYIFEHIYFISFGSLQTKPKLVCQGHTVTGSQHLPLVGITSRGQPLVRFSTC